MSAQELLDRLNREWVRTGSTPHPAVAGWAEHLAQLRGCRTPGDVLDAVAGHPDVVLGLLVARAQQGGGDAELAGRTIVQALLGKMVLLARADRQGGLEDYLAQLWCQLWRYPLARRPHSIAANLWMDTRKAVWAEQGQQPRSTVVPDHVLEELWALSQPPTDVLSVRRVVADAVALGLVDQVSAEVLISVYADGLSSAAAAERHRMSTDLVRWRCSRARRRLAGHAVELAAS